MKKETRAAELDIEKCVINSGVSRFDMVLIVAERTRELKRQNRNSDKVITALDALLELQYSK